MRISELEWKGNFVAPERVEFPPSPVIARSVATKQPSKSLHGCAWVASSCSAVLAMTGLGNILGGWKLPQLLLPYSLLPTPYSL